MIDCTQIWRMSGAEPPTSSLEARATFKNHSATSWWKHQAVCQVSTQFQLRIYQTQPNQRWTFLIPPFSKLLANASQHQRKWELCQAMLPQVLNHSPSYLKTPIFLSNLALMLLSQKLSVFGWLDGSSMAGSLSLKFLDGGRTKKIMCLFTWSSSKDRHC